jgi:hypothetical protein
MWALRAGTSVPRSYFTADGFKLGDWVKNQRAKKDSMPAERKARLDAIGFEWNPLANKRRPAAE